MRLKLLILMLTISYMPKIFADSEEEDLDVFSKCFEEIGCVDTDARWYDPKIRPVNLKPMDRFIIKTDFILIKQNKSAKEESLMYTSMAAKKRSIEVAGFKKGVPIIFLIHDFTSNGYTGWVKHLSMVIFKKQLNRNIIVVDWQRGAEPPYDQAIANARVVALEIIALIKELREKFKTTFEDIYIVGHGVGAHIAGYVGAVFNGIQKITALDPSGPRFDGMPDVVKLNPSNAKYVEVLHTDGYNARSQGTKEKMGTSDFYINNAEHQPGCTENSTFRELVSIGRSDVSEGEIIPGCSHKRAFKYFIEAIHNSDCVFLGIRCDSYEQFTKGKCNSCENFRNDCRTFGLESYKDSMKNVAYYLNTVGATPFCTFQYKISVSIIKKENDKYYGYFDFILIDENNKISNATLADPNSNTREFLPGKNNTYVYYSPAPALTNLKEAKVRWNEKKKFYCFIFCKQSIHVQRVVITNIKTHKGDKTYENTLCPSDGNHEIGNGDYKSFHSCANSQNVKVTTISQKVTTSTEKNVHSQTTKRKSEKKKKS